MKTVAFLTLGCKVNTYESEAMLKLFHQAGYEAVDFKDKADVYVINTCTVTNTGDSKSRQMIRKAIRQNEKAIVCVVGCYSQVASEEVVSIEGVGVVLGTQFRNQIVDFVNEYKTTQKPVIKVADVMKLSRFEDLDIDEFTRNTRAFLKIQDGCNNFCTYCIIPYARGQIRSRTPESVLKQAQSLVDHGFVEIVLTGIHTAGYGQDFENYSFYDLLVDLTTKIKGLKRLRISSIEMSQITQEIIDLIAMSPIIVDHLHIPIQSGCDATLKRMNRHYTTAEFSDKLRDLKEKLPSLSVTTDVIVGFPGETEEEFQQTYQWIGKMHFNQLHVFPYSIRKGTPAARMKDQIDGHVKHDRVKSLMDLSQRLQSEFASYQIGKTLEVLIEERHGDRMVGHASNYLKVHVDLPDSSIGHIYRVKILSQNGTELIGCVESEKNK
ncbi:tRNA (N(6)-L-threonylcarbamoyladenosine(37)-C(2))-methylthiotransferase MtaB [Coprobacillus cateniformis]|uniref:tRNA (N(6)-L-threonylcarbamoyladenosine(37)-C(2))- methylthiotransferase MtaB n=1 Tax=Coprobacillus cateniformis TaxID=100884 RepID=UPI00266C6381|nr:tRNA (N(6)-L-threonylcarbamoyladenosine(37)-C(2))-methylthiotransferase MtaB [Coprobacillus cateniformis]